MSEKIEIAYQDTGKFNSIVCDYLTNNEKLKPFYAYERNIDTFRKIIADKKSFSYEKRDVLVKVLKRQYQNLEKTKYVEKNIASLSQKNTFTVTTGHQLCLFTGPAYFLYKIFETINLANQLNKHYPDNHFVPIYWMATEDHDIAEIDHFTINGKTIKWDTEYQGISGDAPTKGLEKVYEELATVLPEGTEKSNEILDLFKAAYLMHDNLADATRCLVNQLFGKYGVIVLDANEAALKRFFLPVIESELTSNKVLTLASETGEKLEKAGYKKQAYVRDTNLFFIRQGRKLIQKQDDGLLVENDKIYTEKELLTIAEKNPEYFSPNVVLRPLYQEIILPNLAYIGGGSEVAYWIQLKAVFHHFNQEFPMLLLRNSFLFSEIKNYNKIKGYKLNPAILFLDKDNFIHEFVKNNTAHDLTFEKEKNSIQNLIGDIAKKSKDIDPTLESHVLARGKKIGKELEQIGLKFRKAEKRNMEKAIERMMNLKNNILPNDNLQERIENFAYFYIRFGEKWYDFLLQHTDPFNEQLQIIFID